jgi:hypothetical protein
MDRSTIAKRSSRNRHAPNYLQRMILGADGLGRHGQRGVLPFFSDLLEGGQGVSTTACTRDRWVPYPPPLPRLGQSASSS